MVQICIDVYDVMATAWFSDANNLSDLLQVSNKAGYLSHVDLQAEFECAPETIFNILTNSNNCKVLRDIKEVRKRDVLSDRDGVKVCM